MNYQIGTTQAGMIDVVKLGLPIPKATPVDYSEYRTLGDGSQRGVGWQTAVWRYDYITLEELAVLRQFCSGASAQVFIETLKRDGLYDVYTGIMLMTEPETPKADFLLDFVVRFIQLVEV